MKHTKIITLLYTLTLPCMQVLAESPESPESNSSFYKGPPLFQYRPDENRNGQSIDRFGPVGLAIELHKPAWIMKIKSIEKDSPAALTEQLKPGMIIDSINGQVLKDIDPRIQLGNLITDAEAKDGKIVLVVRDGEKAKAKTVTVNIPVLGAYSDTWPLNCPKSDRIVRNLANYLAQRETISLSQDDAPALLFMLSTGEEEDLEVARRWVGHLVEKYKGAEKISINNWALARSGTALGEYYLRTGDQAVLPLLQLLVRRAQWDCYNNGWAHGTYQGKEHMTQEAQMAFGYMAGGHMNAAGVHMPTFLLLAKESGVEIDDEFLHSTLRHFYRYAGHGTVAYGDQLPEDTYVDNGRDGGLAFAMAAAAALTPEGEESVYAKARDHNAVKGFYSTSWMLIGHTGGGVGEVWRSASMGLMYDKKPTKYREFNDHRRWWLELSRRFDGSFGILGGGHRYDRPHSWGVRMGMTYTVPRKTLRITGAPKTQFSKSHQLPDRPWGTKADEMFLSIESAVQPDGSVWDVDAETLANDASRAVGTRLSDPEVPDEILIRYAHHPDQGIRGGAARCINLHGRYHLVPLLLKSDDPRVRHAGAKAIYGTFKRSPMETEHVTPEMVELLMKMINDPEEALWCVEIALSALGQAPKELIEPHIKTLLPYIEHEEWWLQAAVMRPLSKLTSDPRYFEDIMAPAAQVLSKTTRVKVSESIGLLVDGMKDAPPSLQAQAVTLLGNAYLDFPSAEEIHGPDQITMEGAEEVMLATIGKTMASLDGGLDAVLRVGKAREPDARLPMRDLFLREDPANFTPQIKQAFIDILIPDFVENNKNELTAEANGKKSSGLFPMGTMDKLTDLYRKAGIHEYDWQDFGPDHQDMQWHYFSFDPPEKKLWTAGNRYRKVTYPDGMANWYKLDFAPATNGWKRGFAPFGHENGTTTITKTDNNPVCRSADPVKTFWEKEVLMIRGTFTYPEMKPGYRYRILIGGGCNVNMSDGYDLYINGKLLQRANRGPGRGEGGRPRGAFLTPELMQEFNNGPVTIAVKSFLRYPHRQNVKRGYLTVWVQEMKIPPL